MLCLLIGLDVVGDSVIPHGVNSIASINVKNDKASQGFETSAKIKDTRFT